MAFCNACGTNIEAVESTTDPSSVARDLGVDLYPGAHLLKGNAENVSIAGMHATSAQFETDHPPDKVAEFYKAKLPNAHTRLPETATASSPLRTTASSQFTSRPRVAKP